LRTWRWVVVHHHDQRPQRPGLGLAWRHGRLTCESISCIATLSSLRPALQALLLEVSPAISLTPLRPSHTNPDRHHGQISGLWEEHKVYLPGADNGCLHACAHPTCTIMAPELIIYRAWLTELISSSAWNSTVTPMATRNTQYLKEQFGSTEEKVWASQPTWPLANCPNRLNYLTSTSILRRESMH
jgi:hypothetical protein